MPRGRKSGNKTARTANSNDGANPAFEAKLFLATYKLRGPGFGESADG